MVKFRKQTAPSFDSLLLVIIGEILHSNNEISTAMIAFTKHFLTFVIMKASYTMHARVWNSLVCDTNLKASKCVHT